METFCEQYSNAFVAIVNNKWRGVLLQKLQDCGYTIPILIYPSAYASRTAMFGIGTVVEPKAIVSDNGNIGEGCIISVGSIVSHDVEIGVCCHINVGAIVKVGGKIDSFRRLEAGESVLGYESAIVKSVCGKDSHPQ